MEPEEKTTTVVEKKEVPTKNYKKPFILLLGAVIILLILLVLGSFLLLRKANDVAVVAPTPQPTNEEELTPEPSIEDEISLTKSFTSKKLPDLSFNGYTLMYPTDWTLKEERDESTPISTVTLTKEGYSIKIFQAATGGAGCIYEGDLPEGPASDYRTNKYTDLITGFATLRQTESPSDGKMAYAYCQKNTSDGSFGQPTSVGHMNATTGAATPDEDIVAEIEAIVKSLKTL